jgi:hypothetical protein
MTLSPWRISDRYDPALVALADRHYSRQKPGTPQCIPPGTYVALVCADRTAGWVTSWPLYRQDEWRGAWINTLFRKEGDGLASDMIRAAVAHTRHRFPQVPPLGMVTFVNPRQVRHKRDPGRCYRKAGFRHVGTTPKGLLVFQLLAEEMPPPSPRWARSWRSWMVRREP